MEVERDTSFERCSMHYGHNDGHDQKRRKLACLFFLVRAEFVGGYFDVSSASVDVMLTAEDEI